MQNKEKNAAEKGRWATAAAAGPKGRGTQSQCIRAEAAEKGQGWHHR